MRIRTMLHNQIRKVHTLYIRNVIFANNLNILGVSYMFTFGCWIYRFVFATIWLNICIFSVNGCGSYNSDMDLCLGIPCPAEGFETPRKQFLFNHVIKISKIQSCLSYAVKHLRKVMKHLLQHLEIGLRVEFIPAKVPILKINFAPPYDQLEVDMNVNNIAGKLLFLCILISLSKESTIPFCYTIIPGSWKKRKFKKWFTLILISELMTDFRHCV